MIIEPAGLKPRMRTAVRSTSNELRDETGPLDADHFGAEDLSSVCGSARSREEEG